MIIWIMTHFLNVSFRTFFFLYNSFKFCFKSCDCIQWVQNIDLLRLLSMKFKYDLNAWMSCSRIEIDLMNVERSNFSVQEPYPLLSICDTFHCICTLFSLNIDRFFVNKFCLWLVLGQWWRKYWFHLHLVICRSTIMNICSLNSWTRSPFHC